MDAAFGVVVLTQGGRPAELARCLASVREQSVAADVLVVGNGWAPVGVEGRTLTLPENVGAPAGRNAGAAAVAGSLILFLDDDAWLPSADALEAVGAEFASRRRLGALQLRVVGDDGTSMRRWVPRARVGDPLRSGPAFALAEGVTVVRRAAFEEVGGWFGGFFFGHEGIDLTWRLWDAGWEVRYTGDVTARHPTTLAARHAEFYRLNARNRVWVARRNLPAPVLVAYLSVWSLLTSARLMRDRRALSVWWRGFAEGWRTSPGPRRPLRWATVWKLARLGQPPVI